MGWLRQGWFLVMLGTLACGGTVRRNSGPVPATGGSGAVDTGSPDDERADPDPGDDSDAPSDDPELSPTVRCTYGGKTYAVGAKFAASDSCNQCECLADGSVGCSGLDCAARCEQLEQQLQGAFVGARICNVDSQCSGAREDRCGCGVIVNPGRAADIEQVENNRDLLEGLHCPKACAPCTPLGSSYCADGFCAAYGTKQ